MPELRSKLKGFLLAANTIKLMELLLREAMSASTHCLDFCRALDLLAANSIELMEALQRKAMSAGTSCLALC